MIPNSFLRILLYCIVLYCICIVLHVLLQLHINLMICIAPYAVCHMYVDVSSNRKLLAMLLSKRGFEASLAEDGVDCLRVLAMYPPNYFDVVFMDNTMPHLTGIECVRLMRQQLQFNQIIIGLTGNTMEKELRDFLQAGCDIVLSKPLRNQLLDELLLFLRLSASSSSVLGNRVCLADPYLVSSSSPTISCEYKSKFYENQEIVCVNQVLSSNNYLSSHSSSSSSSSSSSNVSSSSLLSFEWKQRT